MITLKTLLGKYPHTEPLMNGRVTSPNVKLEIPISNGRMDFQGFVRRQEYDIGELPLVALLQARDLGKPLILLPAVLKAGYHHGCVYVRTDDRRMNTPKDLEGKTVGVRSNSQTGVVWALGIFANEYGVDISKMNFLIFEDPHAGDHKTQPNVEWGPEGKGLVQMLLDGEVDAIISDLDVTAQPGVRSLLPNAEHAARLYCETYDVVPAGHILAVSTNLSPDVVQEVFRMFSESRMIGDYLHERVDFYRFGSKAIKNTLETVIEYAFQQNMIGRRLTADELYGGDDKVRQLGL